MGSDAPSAATMLASNATTSAPKSTVTVGLTALPPCVEGNMRVAGQAHSAGLTYRWVTAYTSVVAACMQLMLNPVEGRGRQRDASDTSTSRQYIHDWRAQGSVQQFQQRTLRGDSSRRMPCAPGVMSGSANDAVKSGARAGPRVRCGLPATAAAFSRGLVDLRPSGTLLELKACSMAWYDERFSRVLAHSERDRAWPTLRVALWRVSNARGQSSVDGWACMHRMPAAQSSAVGPVRPAVTKVYPTHLRSVCDVHHDDAVSAARLLWRRLIVAVCRL